MIFIDTETALLAPGCLVPDLACLQAARDDGPVEIHDSTRAPGAWVSLINDAANTFCGANVAFDLAVLANATNTLPQVLRAYAEGRVRDVQIRERLLCIERSGDSKSSVSLASLAARHLGVSVDGKAPPKDILSEVLAGDFSRLGELPPRFRYGQVIGVPFEQWPAEFVKYAEDDVILTRDVYYAQGPDALTDEVNQARAAFCLHLISSWGIRTDARSVAALEFKLKNEYADLEQRLIEFGLIRVDESSSRKAKQEFIERVLGDDAPRTASGRIKASAATLKCAMREHFGEDKSNDRATLLDLGIIQVKMTKDKAAAQSLVEKVWGEASPRTDGGAVATDKNSLRRTIVELESRGEDATALRTLASISRPEKMLTTYIPLMKQGAERPINARYGVIKATGRTSCSRPNMQNLPRDGGFRECFVPRDGCVFIQADWTSAEMLALAWLNDHWGHGDTMKRAINEGKDLHVLFASNLPGHNYNYDELLALCEQGDKNAKQMRQFAKIANFGYPGGMGPESFVEYADNWGIRVTLDQSKALKKYFLETWPEMVHYFRKIGAEVEAGGSIKQVPSGRVRGRASYCQAANTYFQGLCADFAKRALWLITLGCWNNPLSPLYGWRVVAFVHDEFILEGPCDKAEGALEELRRLMVKAANEYLPGLLVQTDGKIMTRWEK